MEQAHLTEAEKAELSTWLSRRATAGGWFFMAMALMLIIILVWIWLFGRVDHPIRDPNEIGPIASLLLVLVGVGGWLLGRQRAVRRLFDEPLMEINGRVLNSRPVPYTGAQLQLEVMLPTREPVPVAIGFMGKPDWQVGDALKLLMWQDGRICLRHINHIADFAYLPSPERRRKVRRRIITGVVIYLMIVACAILMGLYGQGRL